MAFTKPPFFQWGARPVASRGLGENLAPPIVPSLALVLLGSRNDVIGAQQQLGLFDVQLPSTYVPGDDIDIIVDCGLSAVDADAKLGFSGVTIAGGAVTAATYGADGGIAPHQDLELYCRQHADPTTMHLADFTPANLYNVDWVVPARARQTLTFHVPGHNLDAGVSACLDWGTPNAGHNVNGGSTMPSGADATPLAVNPGPFDPLQSWIPTQENPPGRYYFTQCIGVIEAINNGTGAAAIPGYPAYGAIPANTRTLAPDQHISIGIQGFTNVSQTWIYSIHVMAGGETISVPITDVYRASLFDSTFPPPQKVNFSPPPAGAHYFWKDFIHPKIVGLRPSGSLLTLTERGSWINATSYTYQWYTGFDGPIPGATLDHYTTQEQNEGELVYCRVTAHNGASSAFADSNVISVTPTQYIRITEDNDIRVTSDGGIRVIE